MNKKLATTLATFGFVLTSNMLFLQAGIADENFSFDDGSVSVSAETLPSGNHLSWQVPGHPKQISLYRDGNFIGDVVGETSYDDYLTAAGATTSTYTLDLIYSDSLRDDGSEILKSDTISLVVIRGSIFNTQSPATAASATSITELRYRTFIREAYVLAPPANVCGDSSWYFKGDDRSYGPSETAFRTSQRVTIDWNTRSITQIPETGHTIHGTVYLGSFTQWDSRHASTAGITLINPVNNGSTATFTVDASVTNPFCNTLVTYPISYHYDVTITKSGNYSLQGSAVLVPDHEAYIRNDSTGVWGTIFKRSNLTFDCLDKVFTPLGCSSWAGYSGAAP